MRAGYSRTAGGCAMRIFPVHYFIAVLFCGCCHCPKEGGRWEYQKSANVLAFYAASGRQLGVIRMAKNMRFCKPVEDGKRIEYAPVIIPPKTGAPTEEDYNEAGWYRNAIEPPNPPEGKIVSSVTYRYDEEENAVVADYTYEDAPKPVRVFSKLKLYGALTQAGLWDAFEAWLKTQTINGVNAYTAFSLAQDLNDENPLFNGVVQEAKTALGVSDEVVEAILEASILDM